MFSDEGQRTHGRVQTKNARCCKLLHDGGFPLAMTDIGRRQSGTELESTCTPSGKSLGKR